MSIKDYEKNSLIVRKSNDLINSKYRSTLLENQIMSVAMTRLEVDRDNEIVATMYPGELKGLTGRGNNLYTELKIASKSMIGHGVVIEDGQGNFKVFPIVKYAEYEDGVFTIKFNEEIRPHIMGLKSNYTTMNLITLTSFKKNATFRMYELLRKELYKCSGDTGAEVTYNISELKFMLSLANLDEQGVQREIAKSKGNIDWDYIYNNVAIEKSYEDWRDLRRAIIIPAQKELEETSDIRFTFKGIRQGGNTYKYIKFVVYHNEVSSEVQDELAKKAKILDERKQKYSAGGLNIDNNEEMHQYTLDEATHQEVYDRFLGHNKLTADDLRLIIEKAHGNDEKVIRAIEMADRQEEIVNYIGWILRCIEDDYKEPIDVMEGSHEVSVVMNEMRNNTKKPEFKQKMWKQIQAKDDFQDFLDYIGCSTEQLDIIYEDADKKLNMYFDWKKGIDISL